MDLAWCTICNRHCADDNVSLSRSCFWMFAERLICLLSLFSHFIALKTAASKILKFLLQLIFLLFHFRHLLHHAFHMHVIHRPSHPTTMVVISFHRHPAHLQAPSWTPDHYQHHHHQYIQHEHLPDNFNKRRNICLLTSALHANKINHSKTERTIRSQYAGYCARTILPTTPLHIRAGFNTCLKAIHV